MKKLVMVILVVILLTGLHQSECRGQASTIKCYADLGSDISMNLSELTPSAGDAPEVYTGVYLFGDNGSQSVLLVLFLDGNPVVQHRKNTFDDTSRKWVENCQTIDPVVLTGNRITSEGWSGEFQEVTVFSGSTIINSNLVASPYPVAKMKGLVINNSTVGITNEFGLKIQNGLEAFPRASVTLLDEPDLKGKSLEELKIMRNEIFARYGRIFKPGGKMDMYFRTVDWYVPRFTEVHSMLTAIEKANIAYIRSFELKP